MTLRTTSTGGKGGGVGLARTRHGRVVTRQVGKHLQAGKEADSRSVQQ